MVEYHSTSRCTFTVSTSTFYISILICQYVNLAKYLYCAVLFFSTSCVAHVALIVHIPLSCVRCRLVKIWDSPKPGYNFLSAKVRSNPYSLLDRFQLNCHNLQTNNASLITFKIKILHKICVVVYFMIQSTFSNNVGVAVQ